MGYQANEVSVIAWVGNNNCSREQRLSEEMKWIYEKFIDSFFVRHHKYRNSGDCFSVYFRNPT